MMQIGCGEVRDGLFRGEPPSAEIRAHLDLCPACAALARSAEHLRSALGGHSSSSGEVDAQFERLRGRIDEEDRHLRGYLRSRPTWVRLGLAALVCLLILGPVFLFFRRSDFDTYPTARMIGVLVAMTAALSVTLWVALRPAHRPPLADWVVPALGSGAAAVLLATSMLPQVGDHPGHMLLPYEMSCFYIGLSVALPVYLLVRALDHEVMRPAALLAACSAGTTANLALQVHCPHSQPIHVLMGHFSVFLVFLGAAALLNLLITRRKTKTPSAR